MSRIGADLSKMGLLYVGPEASTSERDLSQWGLLDSDLPTMAKSEDQSELDSDLDDSGDELEPEPMTEPDALILG